MLDQRILPSGPTGTNSSLRNKKRDLMLRLGGEDFQNLDEADSIDMNNLFLGDGDNSQVND